MDISLKYVLTNKNIEDYAEFIFAEKNLRFGNEIRKQKSIESMKKTFKQIGESRMIVTKENFYLNDVIPLERVIKVQEFKSVLIIMFLDLSDGVIPKDSFKSDKEKEQFILWISKVSEENRVREEKSPRKYDEEELTLSEGVVGKNIYVRDKLSDYILKGKMAKIRLIVSAIFAVMLGLVGTYNEVWNLEDRMRNGSINYVNIIFVLAVIVYVILIILQKRITGSILGHKIKKQNMKYSFVLKKDKVCIKYGDIQEEYVLEKLGGIINKKCLISLVFKNDKGLGLVSVGSMYMSEGLRTEFIKRLEGIIKVNGLEQDTVSIIRKRNKIIGICTVIIIVIVGFSLTVPGSIILWLEKICHVYIGK